MKIRNINGNEIEYPNDSIDVIAFGYAHECMDKEDLKSTGVMPETMLMTIMTNDGKTQAYVARNVVIAEV